MTDLNSVAFINGRFYTMQKQGETCSAVVVRDGKFIYCGNDEEAKQLANGIVIDLNKKTVLPGFIDAHQHVQAYAKGLRKVDLRDAKSIEEVKQRIRLQAAKTQAGKLILATGFNETNFPVPQLPTRYDLDEAAPNNPVIITRYCLHMHVANSMALNAGFDSDNCLLQSMERNETGQLTGRMQEREAAALVDAITDGVDMSYTELKDLVEQALLEANSFGITGIHPIQGKLCNLFEQTYLYQDLRDEGRLTVRIYMGDDELPGCSIRSGLGDDMVRFGFYKIYTDGSMGARTALLNEPFSDDPSASGACHYSQQELDNMVKQAYDLRIQIAVHAIGDRAIEMALESLEKAYLANPRPWEQIRFRLVHCSLINEKILEMFKRLPVIVDIQPGYVSSNIHWSDARVGEKRAPYLFAWKTLLNAGLLVNGTSDLPCESLNPLTGVYAVETRSGFDGFKPEGWQPQERVSRYEAISFYTKNPAYASFEENIKGTIATGKLADFVVFDRDIFAIEAAELLEAKVEATYLSGKAVYTRT